MGTFTDAEQELCEVFVVLKDHKDLQKLWGSRLTALQCDMHLGAGMAPLYTDGMEPFVSPPFIGFDICCWEDGEGGDICM